MAESVFIATVREVACTHCGADRGERCQTPKGKGVWPPHRKRANAYRYNISDVEFKRRHFVPVKNFDSIKKAAQQQAFVFQKGQTHVHVYRVQDMVQVDIGINCSEEEALKMAVDIAKDQESLQREFLPADCHFVAILPKGLG